MNALQDSPLQSDTFMLPRITQIFLCISQFLYGSANACYYSFLAIWLSANDFTYAEIGYIRGINQLAVLICVPLLCLFIDILSKNNQIRRQFLFSLFCIIVAVGRLSFIYFDHSWNALFCILIAVFIAIQETTNSTMDSIILSMIPNPNKYGRYRLWAGIGWGIVAFSLGLIFNDYLSINTMFYFFAVFMGSLGIIWLIPSINAIFCAANNISKNKSSLFINAQNPEINDGLIEIDHHFEKNKGEKIGFCRKLCLFFSQLTLFKLQIIFSILILGISFGVINTFLFLRLQEMGGSTFLMGMTLIVTICSEFPAFWFVEYALVYIGDLGIVCVGLFAYMLRLSWYGLLGFHGIFDNPWYVLPAETLHGLTYAWIKASICIFAHRLANNETMKNNEQMNINWSSFSQGFLSAIFNGFGQGIGGVVGGQIYHIYGPHYLFFGNAAGLLPFFIVYALQFCCCRNRLRVDPKVAKT